MILVPFGTSVLALEEPEFRKALERGREMIPPEQAGTARKLLDFDGCEAETGIPRSWWKEACRTGRVPCYRIGRYVRVDLNDVLDAARSSQHG